MNMQSLQQEAQQILKALDLVEVLSRYGRAEVVGSVALDLIVKLDLDIHLLIDHADLFGVVNSITEYLLDHPKVREVRITDWRDEGGIKIGVDEYAGPSGNWTIDIWVTDQIESTAFETVQEILGKLTAENRDVILSLKEHYYRQGKLRNGLSLKIYRAVLDGGINTVSEFERRYELE